MRNWKVWLLENLDLPAMGSGRHHRVLQELADHLEEMEKEALSRGADAEEAEAEVLAWLGDPSEAAQELIRCDPGHVRARMTRWAEEREELLRARGSRWVPLADLIKDLRLGLRGLAKRPLFSGVSILVLALGIGATTAIFTLLDAVILSPLPFEEADRLVAVQHAAPARGLADAGQCAAWHFTYEAENQVFQDLGMFTDYATASITGSGTPEAVPALQVTSGVFRALRLDAEVGRIFSQDDEDLEATATVMLGYGYWRSRFGGDPGVVGQTLQVDGVSREIIGVTPPVVRALGSDPSVILPLRFRHSSLFVGNIGYDAVGRLREGVTLEAAAAELNRILPMAWELFPGGPTASSSDPSHYQAQVLPLQEDIVGPVASLFWILMGGVAVVLFIACANVANLFLVRAEGKDGEMAVRVAMGASRRRISWEYLKESLLLGVVGGAGGLILSQLGLQTLIAMAPSEVPRMDEVSLNPTVLAFATALSLGAGLFFGIFPLLRNRRGSPVESLKDEGRGGTGDRRGRRTRTVLATGQLALALVLLVASGLMLRSFQSLRNTEPGFQDPEEILALRVYVTPQEVRRSTDVAVSLETMARRLEDIPGVEAVGLATGIPMDGWGNVNPFYVQGQTLALGGPRISRRHKWIGPGYLPTLRIPILMGRNFTWDDIHNRAPVAILSESLAREVFGSLEDALGGRIAARPDPPQWKEVVGIVADVLDDGMNQAPPALVYWPHVTLGFWEGNSAEDVQVWRGAGFAVRSGRLGTQGFIEEVQRAIWEVNPNLPVERIRPLTSHMEASMAGTSFTLILLGLAGSISLALGLVGVYGVISYSVAQRRRELGMRMALGARPTQVRTLVLRQGLAMAALGIGLGLAMAFALTRLMSSLLFGVEPSDPLTYVGMSGGLLVVALVASYVPAIKASRVDPASALRLE